MASKKSSIISSGDWVSGENFTFTNSPHSKKISLGGGSVRSPINTRRRTLYHQGSQNLVGYESKSTTVKSQSVIQSKTIAKSSKVKSGSTTKQRATAAKMSALNEVLEVVTADPDVVVQKKTTKKIQKKESPKKTSSTAQNSTSRRKSVVAKTETKSIAQSSSKAASRKSVSAAKKSQSADDVATKNLKPTKALPVDSVKAVEVVLDSMIAERVAKSLKQVPSNSPQRSPVKVVEKDFTAIKPASKVDISPTVGSAKPQKSDWMSSLPSNAILPRNKAAVSPVMKTTSPIKQKTASVSTKSAKVLKSVSKPSSSTISLSSSKSSAKAKSVRKTRLSVATNLSSPPNLAVTSESMSTVTVANDGSPVLMQSRATSAKPRRSLGRPPKSAKKEVAHQSPGEIQVLPSDTALPSTSKQGKRSMGRPPKSAKKEVAPQSHGEIQVLSSDTALPSTSKQGKRSVGRPPKSAKKEVAPQSPGEIQVLPSDTALPSTSKQGRRSVGRPPKSSYKSMATSTTDVLDGSSPILASVENTRKRKVVSTAANNTVPKKAIRLRQTPTRISTMYMTPVRDSQLHDDSAFVTPATELEVQSTAGHTPYKNRLMSASTHHQKTPTRIRKQNETELVSDYEDESHQENADVSVMEEHPIQAAATSNSWWCSIM